MTLKNSDLLSGKDATLEQTLVFRAGEEHFGISLSMVLEVFQPTSPAIPVPGASRWLLGILHHHGEVLPVVCADILLKTEKEQGQDIAGQLMLLDLAGQKVLLQADSIVALENLQSGGPIMSDGNRRAWLKGRLLTLLDPQYLNTMLTNHTLE